MLRKATSMLNIAFWFEFRRRADALVWLALVNPPVLLLYALTSDSPRPALEIWLIGLGATFLVCLTGALMIYFSTTNAIQRGVSFVRREKFLMDLAARGPRMRKIEPRQDTQPAPRIEPPFDAAPKAG